jgi:hypothetical protein
LDEQALRGRVVSRCDVSGFILLGKGLGLAPLISGFDLARFRQSFSHASLAIPA